MTILEAAASSFGKYRTATTLTDIHRFSPKRYREKCSSTERLFYPRLLEALSLFFVWVTTWIMDVNIDGWQKYWRTWRRRDDVVTSWIIVLSFVVCMGYLNLSLEYISPRLIWIIFLFFFFLFHSYDDDDDDDDDDDVVVIVTTSWRRRRDDIVTTTSWWRRIYVDYSPFQPKTLRL